MLSVIDQFSAGWGDKRLRGGSFKKLDAQFEVNIPPEEVRALLAEFFRGWEVLWDKCIHYEYPVPRGERVAVISSEVVTFTARRPQ